MTRSAFGLAILVAAVACGGPRPVTGEPSTTTDGMCRLLEHGASDDGRLEALYREHHTPLVLYGNDVMACDCVAAPKLGGATESSKLGGATETSKLGGATETSKLGGATESSKLGGATESSKLGGATETSKLGGATESSKLGGATESSKLGGAVETVACHYATDCDGFVVSGVPEAAYGSYGRRPLTTACVPRDR